MRMPHFNWWEFYIIYTHLAMYSVKNVCHQFKPHLNWSSTGESVYKAEELQGAKKIIFTACLSGKLKLEFTSPDIISNGPKPFWRAELISQFSCYSNSSKSITCPSGKLKTEFTCPIAKSTSLGLSDTTFFARWIRTITCLQQFFFSFSSCLAPYTLHLHPNTHLSFPIMPVEQVREGDTQPIY